MQAESNPKRPRADHFKARGTDQHTCLLKHALEIRRLISGENYFESRWKHRWASAKDLADNHLRLSRRAVRVPAQAVWFLVGAAMLWSLFAKGIRHVRALEASLISTIEPVLNPIWVALLRGKRPQSWALAGGLLVLGAATTGGVLTARAAASGTAWPAVEKARP